jgi:hypothetical protein
MKRLMASSWTLLSRLHCWETHNWVQSTSSSVQKLRSPLPTNECSPTGNQYSRTASASKRTILHKGALFYIAGLSASASLATHTPFIRHAPQLIADSYCLYTTGSFVKKAAVMLSPCVFIRYFDEDPLCFR